MNSSLKRFYRPELDALRALAFLMVFIHHALSGLGVAYSQDPGVHWYALIVAQVIGLCGFGLPLFFFLSAYLISKLLLIELEREGKIDVWGFFVRRALRIWPLYYPAVIAGAFFALHHPGPRNSLSFVAPFSFFYANWYTMKHVYIDNPLGPLWSISVEEQFYILLPWFFLLPMWNRQRLQILGTGLIGISLVALWLQGQAHLNYDISIWWNSFTKAIFFGCGIVFATIEEAKIPEMRISLRSIAAISSIALLFASSYIPAYSSGNATSGFMLVACFSLQALASITLLLTVWDAGERMPNWIVYLGKISFGLYVFHLWAMQVIMHIHFLDMESVPRRRFLALVLDIIIASASYAFYEKPILSLRKRFTHVVNRPL